MRKKYLLLIISLILVSCQKNEKQNFEDIFTSKNYEEDILGTWVIESVIEYSNGVEKELDINETETYTLEGEKRTFLKNEGIMGSIQNPKYYKFTKYNELYVYDNFDKNKSDEIVSRYDINKDIINCEYIETNRTYTLEVISLKDDKLTLKQEMGCLNCPEDELRRRTIWTFNFRKVSQ